MIGLSEEQIALFKSRNCAVACSSGVDSVVLTHLLVQAGIKPTLLHVNYGLRGVASDDDAAFVENLGQRLNLDVVIEKHSLAHLKNSSGNIQAEARTIRYQLFHDWLSEHENSVVLLAHHADDQIETFYLNLARKSGVAGLAAMPEQRDRIIRPLLKFRKAEIRQFAAEQRISFREDASNASNDYSRNKLRNLIIPELEKAIPTLHESIGIMISKFQEEFTESGARVATLLSDILNDLFLPNNLLKSCSETEVLLLFEALGFGPAQVPEILTLQRKGAFVEAGENKHDIAAIYKGIGGFELAVKTELPLPQLQITEVNTLPPVFTKTELYLDADQLNGELQVRRIQTGDRMRIVGMKGSKLLSDILNDNKAGIRAKQQAVVVTDNKNILWFPGYAVAPDAVATATSTHILKVWLEA